MNVLYVTHSDDKYGGAKSIQTIIKNISKYNVRPVVVSLRKNRYNEIADEAGISNYVVRYIQCTDRIGDRKLKQVVKALRCFAINFVAQRKILKIVDRENIDIIHINTSVIDVGTLARKRRNIRLVWHIREFLDIDYDQVYFNKRQVERMRRSCDKFIFISNAIKKHWENKGIVENSTVIYNGINIGSFEFNDHSTHSNLINIAFVGSISPNKGQYQLIDAIAEMLPEYRNKLHVYFYGNGTEEYENELKKKIADAQIENLFTFAGFTENISEALTKCSIGVVASKSEGFGRVTVEYMLSGVLVIASNSGANGELIQNQETGLLFRYGDVKDLSNNICWIMDHKEKFDQIRKNAYKTAKEKFSEEQYVSRIYKVYEEQWNEG